MAILSRSLRTSVASSILNSIYNKTSRYYYFFGQPNDFDSNQPTESTSLEYENKTRNNIFAIKEVLPSDACYVIPRVDYQSGVEYSQYSTLTDVVPYVYNPTNFSIYICILAGSGLSTVEPSHTNLTPMTLGDGYVWRYVYTIPLALRNKYLTSEWIPVNNALNEAFFSNGSIGSASIIDNGEGYSTGSTSIIVGDSTGNGHGAVMEPIINSGKIVSVVIQNPGYGYITPTIEILSPTATRKAVISPSLSQGDIRSSQSLIQTLAKPGTIESVEIVSPGSGYTENMSVVLAGDGTGGAVSLVRNTTTGQITSAVITNRGEGYTWATITINDTPIVGGSGFVGHINLSPVKGFGYDVVSDLRASSVMIFQALSRETLGGNEFNAAIRQFGVIQNPRSTDRSLYPNQQVSKDNFITTVPLLDVSKFPVNTVIYSEFPTTSNTKTFVVEEQIIGKIGGLRLRATNGGKISIGSRYYRNATNSFVATLSSDAPVVDKRFVSGCYTLETTSPNFFDINTFTEGTIVRKNGKRFVILSSSSLSIAVSSIDGETLTTGDVLVDDFSNTLTPESITDPAYDKKTGYVLTIESTAPVSYSQSQSVSFRTVLKL